ncbi:phosphoenolpyruvate--protein phosphotransferase [Kiritimatiella glycovorans]|uniref:phosphoenolpyruvate--protein phosphotransferase n=1 Tax=Kiritimatiella glycovorans TaxID=1307763 RepID=A0A0G3EJR7_9BACT|nr:phosphoenolpyruvate--protein phosphotransferase [Kiritimatiella glycovorans]AKJ64369.1 Phosphoenolpyruvate-protein phosphotransferase [Kiritimatiella glycovorans]
MTDRDHLDLVYDISEFANLFESSQGLDEFLDNVVDMISRHMKAEVCSIYLLEDSGSEIVMRANRGLKPDAIGRVRLRVGEGITGVALRELRPINVGHASHHPDYRFVPGIDEESYEAFLALPIARGLERIGVLVLQDRQPDRFGPEDIKTLRTISSQLARTIEGADLLLSIHQAEARDEKPRAELEPLKFLRGTPASGGIVLGKAALLDAPDIEAFLEQAPERKEPFTVEDFNRALRETEQQLEELQSQVEEQLDDVAGLIFNAHLLILKDEEFSGSIRRMIEGGMTPRQAVVEVVNRYVQFFTKSRNARLREKIHDIKDLGHRLLHNLFGVNDDHSDYSGHIIIASEVLPSELLSLSAQNAAGLLMMRGGVSAHVNILARSIQMPMVVLDEPRSLPVEEGTELLLDAYQGTVFVEPDDDVRDRYRELTRREHSVRTSPWAKQEETYTGDAVRVTVQANINLLSDLRRASGYHAEGVGLYRSEFPFLIRDDFPMEDEQLRIYRQLCDSMGTHEITIRTLDIGGDKMLSYYAPNEESNPFLGLRAIRFSLRNRDIFREQLRAILRAAEDRRVRIMFPMISSVDDYVEAADIVRECERELRSEGVATPASVELGPMVELPSAVEVVHELAEHADFMSIGTNDLIQYMLAVDRTNEQVANFYVPHHPAVLRAVKKIAEAAERNGTDCSVCGEAALDPGMLPFFLGVGLRKFSVDVHRIPEFRAMLAALDIEQCREAAERMLSVAMICELDEYIERMKRELYGESYSKFIEEYRRQGAAG